jgi:hypothetical protein
MLVLVFILIITGVPMAIISLPVMKYLRETMQAQKASKQHPSQSA